MYKPCNIVMLPTNKKADIGDNCIVKHNTTLSFGKKVQEARSIFEEQHLYITSNEPIKEERLRWIIDKRENMNNYIHQVSVILDSKVCPEILVTTDSSLAMLINDPIIGKAPTFFPQPSQAFIEHYVSEYNKGNVITEVMVEFECYARFILADMSKEPDVERDTVDKLFKPKINQDNTINIKPVKDSWSKEEIEKLLIKHQSDYRSQVRNTNNWSMDIGKWIKENL